MATVDEVTGILCGWAAEEAHATARKLAAVREIIRRHAGGSVSPGESCPGDLPRHWDIGVAHEVAAALGISWQAADPLVNFAWDLEGRLPGTGKLLDDGVLSYQKAKIISDEFSVLDDAKAPEAEKKLLARILGPDGRLLDGMMPGAIGRICQRIVCTVDAAGAAKRREAAERDGARVRFFRDHGGAGALFASGLPADEALRSESNIAKRAKEYRAAGLYPDDSMDMLRVLALVDSINSRSLEERIAAYRAEHPDEDRPDTGRDADTGNRNDDGDDDTDDDGYGDDSDPRDDDGDPRDDDGGPGEDDGGSGSDGSGGGVPAGKPDPRGLPALVHLILPLATLGGLADRPGEVPGYGALDPDLTRKLAVAAAASPRTRFCLTITDANGYAAYHGCARLIRGAAGSAPDIGYGPGRGQSPSRDGSAPEGWDLTPDRDRAGPDGGRGAWILTVPGGIRYRVDLRKIPVDDCDHRYATGTYRPGALLRHLVEVRDGECTSVSCSMPARKCDFEHAVPYDQGGATDACNGGMRSRHCHRVKQSRGWAVTQIRPGWHRWTAPSGRSYTKGPMRYPA